MFDPELNLKRGDRFAKVKEIGDNFFYKMTFIN